jgi:hypothetical protein
MFMESILQSNTRLLRALLFLICLTALIYFSVTRIFQTINTVSDISVEVNEKGGLIFKATRKGSEISERYAQFLLPSNKVWVNTGIDVEENEECDFKITGNVHLAINNLITHVDNDQIPKIKWTGPEGAKWENIGDKPDCADAKTKLLIKPGDRIGNVVGYFYNNLDISDQDFLQYFMINRKAATKDVFNIGEKLKQPNNTGKKARLFISANDILLDMTDTVQKKISQIAFEGRVGENNAQNWKLLLNEPEYFRLWFDDNVGGFLVNVTIRKKKS